MPKGGDVEPRSGLVLTLAPTGRDAELITAVLRDAGIAVERCADVAELCRAIARGAGAALLSEEALSPASIQALNAALREQPPWSDLPIVLVTGAGEHQEARQRTVKQLDPAGNVTILERPFRKLTLVTAFEAALRARRRQYEMRDLMRALVRAEQERAEAAARERSEALYRALARNYPNGAVLIFDRSLRCTLAEGQGLAALGLSPAVEGRALADVLPRALADRLEPGCQRAAFAGQTITSEIAHEGQVHLVHCVPLPGADGGIEAAMIVTQDITAQKRAEEELRRDARFRERFIGVLAHDLRTPVQAIAFLADGLTRGLDAEAVRLRSARIQRAAERMARMIGDLLDLTRSRQGGGIPLAPKEADLAVICRRTIEEIQVAHPDRSIQLTTRGDARGAWDADRVSQVVSNLVVNAVSYSAAGTEVAVDLRADDGEVVLRVQNHGAPIPPAVISTLFAPFSRGARDGEDAQAQRGLGLGLFIVDRIVRAHGGDVRVHSTAEDGTTFTVSVPRRPALAPPGAAALDPPGRPGSGACADDAAPDRREVLVVEDDETIRDTLRELLEDEGYRVVTATNGREALDVLSHGARPCVILLDLMMPVMSGWQVLDALCRDADLAKLPVVVVSAANACDPPPGARRCLPKPIHLGTLLEVVHEQCAA